MAAADPFKSTSQLHRRASKPRPWERARRIWSSSATVSKKKESSSPLIPSSFLQSFSLSVGPQILMEYLVCVFCSKDAAMIKTHENHCPRGAFVAIDRDGLCGSLACFRGAQCSLLNGRGVKGLGQGHMVSLGQSWDEEPQAAASCSRGLW